MESGRDLSRGRPRARTRHRLGACASRAAPAGRGTRCSGGTSVAAGRRATGSGTVPRAPRSRSVLRACRDWPRGRSGCPSRTPGADWRRRARCRTGRADPIAQDRVLRRPATDTTWSPPGSARRRWTCRVSRAVATRRRMDRTAGPRRPRPGSRSDRRPGRPRSTGARGDAGRRWRSGCSTSRGRRSSTRTGSTPPRRA